MSGPDRNQVMIKLDQIDTALEAPDADKTAILGEAEAWLSANPPAEAADALYYRERLQAVRERHQSKD